MISETDCNPDHAKLTVILSEGRPHKRTTEVEGPAVAFHRSISSREPVILNGAAFFSGVKDLLFSKPV